MYQKYLIGKTIQRLKCVIGYFDVKYYKYSIEKVNLHNLSAQNWESA